MFALYFLLSAAAVLLAFGGGVDALAGAFQALRLVGVVPLVGLLLLPLAMETRGRALAD